MSTKNWIPDVRPLFGLEKAITTTSTPLSSLENAMLCTLRWSDDQHTHSNPHDEEFSMQFPISEKCAFERRKLADVGVCAPVFGPWLRIVGLVDNLAVKGKFFEVVEGMEVEDLGTDFGRDEMEGVGCKVGCVD